jgi:deoxyribose-phosphate aldolase
MSTRVNVENLSAAQLAKYIDHTLLKPEATPAQIEQICSEAKQYGFAAVCVNPCNVRQVAASLSGTEVKTASVAGFPLGACLPQVKAYEAEQAILDGAQEIDMVINVGALKAGNDALVREDIEAVARASHRGRAICKVIIEAALLTDDEKARACLIVQSAGADYVKTSTGFASGGATVEDVALMRRVVGDEMGVKAAGGIRSLEQMKAMIAAGATRVGCSSSVKIMQEAKWRE